MRNRAEELERTIEMAELDRSRRHIASWVIGKAFFYLLIFGVLFWQFYERSLGQEEVWYKTDFMVGVYAVGVILLVVFIDLQTTLYSDRQRLTAKRRLLNN